MQRRSVLVFLKYPAQGRVKTRLASSLGDAEAVAIYRRLVERVLENLSKSPVDEVRMMFDPPGADDEAAVREWLAPSLEKFSPAMRVSFFAQDQGDLGDRLRAGFSHAFVDGCDVVAAIGTDCVAIDADTFAEAWRRLESDDAVFGPTDDGGYYLVAMKAMQAGLFENIPWSTGETLARSLDQAESSGLVVGQLATLADVDTADDWERARAEFFPGVEPSQILFPSNP